MFLDKPDVPHLLERLNQDDEIAFIVQTGDQQWIARQTLDSLPDGEYVLWHTAGGPLPLEEVTEVEPGPWWDTIRQLTEQLKPGQELIAYPPLSYMIIDHHAPDVEVEELGEAEEAEEAAVADETGVIQSFIASDFAPAGEEPADLVPLPSVVSADPEAGIKLEDVPEGELAILFPERDLDQDSFEEGQEVAEDIEDTWEGQPWEIHSGPWVEDPWSGWRGASQGDKPHLPIIEGPHILRLTVNTRYAGSADVDTDPETGQPLRWNWNRDENMLGTSHMEWANWYGGTTAATERWCERFLRWVDEHALLVQDDTHYDHDDRQTYAIRVYMFPAAFAAVKRGLDYDRRHTGELDL